MIRLSLFSVAVSALVFCSCNDSESQSQLPPPPDTLITPAASTDTIPTTAHTPDTTVTCYNFDKDIEHNWMVMTRIGDTAYGELHYTWEGKDGSNGTFHGTFSGDTLWAMFNSHGEGHHVDIEVAFLVSGDKLLEGRGMQESNDESTRYWFQHKEMIEFSKTEYLVKRVCM